MNWIDGETCPVAQRLVSCNSRKVNDQYYFLIFCQFHAIARKNYPILYKDIIIFVHGDDYYFTEILASLKCCMQYPFCNKQYHFLLTPQSFILEMGALGFFMHYNDVIMDAMSSQITNLTIVYSTVYSGADQRKRQSSTSLAFVWRIHR